MRSLRLALDCGSTNLKAALFNEKHERLSDASIPLRYGRRDRQICEFDPRQWWQDAQKVIQHAYNQAGGNGQIDTVAVTSQAQTFTILDRQGEALLPFISWMDYRAVEEAEELAQLLGEDFHDHCSFGQCIGQLLLAKLLWVKRRLQADVWGKVQLVTLPGYLFYQLSGVNLTDDNLAAMNGLYSLKQKDWWHEALQHCGVNVDMLGRLTSVGECVRASSRDCGLPLADNLTLISAGNDQTAGAYGNHCHQGGMIITLGTALVVYRYAGKTAGPYTSDGCWGPYPSGGYYELAVSDYGCAALDWARHALMPDKSLEDFFAQACQAQSQLSQADASNPVLFYPEKSQQAKAWIGAGSAGQKALAVLEGIGFQLKRLIDNGIGSTEGVSCLGAIGGGSQSGFWLERISAILGYPIRAEHGDSLIGAVYMATAQGQEDNAAETLLPIAPLPEQQIRYQHHYRRWVEKYCD